MWVYELDWAGPGQRQLADACECGNEPSFSVKMRWAGHVAHMGEEMGVVQGLVGEAGGKETTGETKAQMGG